jgi:L-threonylcarbamoyladenylate synthase
MGCAPVLPADRAAIARAATLIRGGELVAIPTETVYGLAGDATSDRAVAKIFEAKARPAFNPLIVHVLDRDAGSAYAEFDPAADRLAAAFWPGPLTLVLRRQGDCKISPLASAGLDTIAIRSPAHPVARALIGASGLPLAAPSANPAGRLSPTRADHVAAMLGERVALILDGGPCPIGLESTVVDLSGPRPALLRAGAVTPDALEGLLGHPLASPADGPARSPGMMSRHYAPSIPIRLDADHVGPTEALLAFGPHVPTGAAETLNLSPTGDTTEAASNLFAMLHRLDKTQFSAIAVMPVPMHGLGIAINDRLRRAAQPDDVDMTRN